MKSILLKLMAGIDLARDEARGLLNALLSDSANNSQIAAALVALAIKGDTSEELAGMAQAMREHAARIDPVHERFIDTAGTGSSRVKTFNVSTAAAFVIAGAGLPVAKHGSRAATSKSGSADVLAALGVNVSAGREVSEACLNEIGMCFMFAPLYHASTARVAAVRRELGVHTTFNLLGPLTNPAGAPFQVLGVWHENLVAKVAETLNTLGTQKAWVVHGLDGLDELTLNGTTRIAEVTPRGVDVFEVSPEDFGIESVSDKEMAGLRGGDAERNAEIVRRVLDGTETGPAMSLVLLNASAALFVGGEAAGFDEAAALARESISSGRAIRKLEELKVRTNA
ncbi:MAG: anthranilate phosphoribosyltransferase [Acidobacteria bacterium]|nr:anthranilate phosphoribosyltransferase [Acidobacteriota bacterium]